MLDGLQNGTLASIQEQQKSGEKPYARNVLDLFKMPFRPTKTSVRLREQYKHLFRANCDQCT
jgi:hypothetical protein